MGRYYSDDVIASTDLDLFNITWHKHKNVPDDIAKLALDLESYHKYRDYSFNAPQRGISMDPNHVLRGLKSIELNPTELCNRTCHFCPRYDPNVYPNQNLHLSVDTAAALLDDLVKNKYGGQVDFSGMGEPLLNKDILTMIKMYSDAGIYTRLITNGDKILQERWFTLDDFVEAGLSVIDVDVYDDSEQYQKWCDKLSKYSGKIRFEIHPRFLAVTRVFNSRTGMSTHEAIRTHPNQKTCYTPASKAFIDWDGSVMLCCHDWSRSGGNFGNINEQPFHEIWNSDELNKVRFNLMNKSRLDCGTPCDKCNTTGNQGDSYVKEMWDQVLTYEV